LISGLGSIRRCLCDRMIVRIYGFADIYGHTNMAALNLGHHYGRHRHLTHGAAFHFSDSTAFSMDY
jgi:hypothetical protein